MILSCKQINDDVIVSYYFSKYNSGIYHLLINTKYKWQDFHRYDNNLYLIGDSVENVDDYILNISEIEIPSKHLCTNIQDDNQISFYWIPFNLIIDK